MSRPSTFSTVSEGPRNSTRLKGCPGFSLGELMSMLASGFNRLFVTIVVLMAATQAVAAQQSSPYCPVPVYYVANHPLGGQATFGPNGGLAILVDPLIPQKLPYPHGSNFMRFLLAHECAHHMQGHLQQLGQAGMFGQYALMQTSHSLELAADCAATKLLAGQGDIAAVQSAHFVFSHSNPFPTASHPAGQVRANNIYLCLN